jgi:hypothetical protein
MSAKTNRVVVFSNYAFPPSEEDEGVLLARLRLAVRNVNLDLRLREALIPYAAGMAVDRRVEAIYLSDLALCETWLTERKPTLEELQLITSILNKWRDNHVRTNPYWTREPTPEEIEVNRMTVEVAQRLIAKGQYKDDTNESHQPN